MSQQSPINPEDFEAFEELDRDVKRYSEAFDDLERDEALEEYHREVEKYRVPPDWTGWDVAALVLFALLGCLFWTALFVRFLRQS